MAVDLSRLRTDYARAGLDERDVDPSPDKQIDRWLGEAVAAGHPEPNAMMLATVSASGVPSARIVLVRAHDARGLVFFTNYDSDKGRDLEANPVASATFFWVLLERQLRVTGRVAKIARAESEAYFRTRPRESQLGAWASRQSSVLAGRGALEAELADVRARFGEDEVPCPPNWGGYGLVPERVELWQGRPSRLHDRLVYQRAGAGGDAWTLTRLSP